jgi:hypothetical protein
MEEEFTDFEDYMGPTHEPQDIPKFLSMLGEAWETMPEVPFNVMLSEVFNGYDLSQLTGEELEELLNEFILNNMK